MSDRGGRRHSQDRRRRRRRSSREHEAGSRDHEHEAEPALERRSREHTRRRGLASRLFGSMIPSNSSESNDDGSSSSSSSSSESESDGGGRRSRASTSSDSSDFSLDLSGTSYEFNAMQPSRQDAIQSTHIARVMRQFLNNDPDPADGRRAADTTQGARMPQGDSPINHDNARASRRRCSEPRSGNITPILQLGSPGRTDVTSGPASRDTPQRMRGANNPDLQSDDNVQALVGSGTDSHTHTVRARHASVGSIAHGSNGGDGDDNSDNNNDDDDDDDGGGGVSDDSDGDDAAPIDDDELAAMIFSSTRAAASETAHPRSVSTLSLSVASEPTTPPLEQRPPGMDGASRRGEQLPSADEHVPQAENARPPSYQAGPLRILLPARFESSSHPLPIAQDPPPYGTQGEEALQRPRPVALQTTLGRGNNGTDRVMQEHGQGVRQQPLVFRHPHNSSLNTSPPAYDSLFSQQGHSLQEQGQVNGNKACTSSAKDAAYVLLFPVSGIFAAYAFRGEYAKDPYRVNFAFGGLPKYVRYNPSFWATLFFALAIATTGTSLSFFLKVLLDRVNPLDEEVQRDYKLCLFNPFFWVCVCAGYVLRVVLILALLILGT